MQPSAIPTSEIAAWMQITGVWWGAEERRWIYEVIRALDEIWLAEQGKERENPDTTDGNAGAGD